MTLVGVFLFVQMREGKEGRAAVGRELDVGDELEFEQVICCEIAGHRVCPFEIWKRNNNLWFVITAASRPHLFVQIAGNRQIFYSVEYISRMLKAIV